jgi:hypothetical protein
LIELSAEAGDLSLEGTFSALIIFLVTSRLRIRGGRLRRFRAVRAIEQIPWVFPGAGSIAPHNADL